MLALVLVLVLDLGPLPRYHFPMARREDTQDERILYVIYVGWIFALPAMVLFFQPHRALGWLALLDFGTFTRSISPGPFLIDIEAESIADGVFELELMNPLWCVVPVFLAEGARRFARRRLLAIRDMRHPQPLAPTSSPSSHE